MNLVHRLIVAAIFIPLILFIGYTDNHVWLSMFSFLIACGAVFEVYRMFGIKRVFYYGLTILFAAYVMLASYWKASLHPLLLIVFFISMLSYEVLLYNEEKERELRRILVAIFANLYIILFLQYLIVAKTHLPRSSMWIPIFFITVWIIDTAAYGFGMWLGKKHRGLIAVSPKKSLEGFVGGIVLPAGLAAIFHHTLGISILHAIVGTAVFSVTVQMGDLAESLIKRYANVKDSSNIIIGHGGIFDRFDSMIFSIPVFYYLVQAATKLLP